MSNTPEISKFFPSSSCLSQSTNTRDKIHMVKYRFQPAFQVVSPMDKASPAPQMVAENQKVESTKGELPCRTRMPVCQWTVWKPDPETIARKKEFMDKTLAEMDALFERRKQVEEKRAKQKQVKKIQAKEKQVKKKQWKKENQAKKNEAKKNQVKKQAKKKLY